MARNNLIYRILILFMLCTIMTSMMARPAWKEPVAVPLPDGTSITLILHGDEFLHFSTTVDGFTVVRGADGFYYYAEKHNGQLRATSTKATDVAKRTSAELSFLANQKKMICPEMTKAQQILKQRSKSLYTCESNIKRTAPQKAASNRIDYGQFKGLIVLVEFNDRKFLRDDAKDFYTKLTSEKNLEGYYDTSRTKFKACYGSVRDYFYENSNGIFDPSFDVVGPITINYSAKQAGYDNLEKIIISSIKEANKVVDFSKYDLNTDGYVDMVYFIYAGYGSFIEGNDSNLLWPHASDLTSIAPAYNLRYDGKWIGRYACSVEILDRESNTENPTLDGIGTICHEFSHVLGLADHYDTNYEEDGACIHPGGWDIMANGADYNNGLNPVGYSSYERYSLGFTPKKTLSSAGQYELNPFNDSNDYFIINTPTQNEVFYIENRQKQGWDAYLPSHGMLVWRVDSTNAYVWRNNSVNCKDSHLYLELLRAVPEKAVVTNQLISDSGYDPYPGYGKVTDLTADTYPALLNWRKEPADMDIYDISESNGIVSFTAGKDLYPIVREDFENVETTSADVKGHQGAFCLWDLSKATIALTEEEGYGNGNHVARVSRSGNLTTSTLDQEVRSITFSLWTGSSQVRAALKANINGSWKYINTINNEQMVTVNRNSQTHMNYKTPIPAGSQLQIQILGTSNNAIAYIDDILITYGEGKTAIHNINADDTRNQTLYNLAGQKVDDDYRGIVICNGRKYLKK